MITRKLNRIIPGKDKLAEIKAQSRQYHNFAGLTPIVTLPSKVDKTNYASPIENQGDEGSCTAHANAGVVEYLQNVEITHKISGAAASLIFPGGAFARISRSMIYWNERDLEGTTDQDSGAMLSDGVAVVEKIGVCREILWPYSDATMYTKPSANCYAEAAQHKVLYSYQINDLQHMKHSLASGFPFVFGVVCYDSFLSDVVAQDGIIPLPGSNENVQGGHALSCFGYDDNMTANGLTGFFKFRNSWGTGWGQAGYGWIPYAYLTDPELSSEFYTYRYTK